MCSSLRLYRYTGMPVYYLVVWSLVSQMADGRRGHGAVPLGHRHGSEMLARCCTNYGCYIDGKQSLQQSNHTRTDARGAWRRCTYARVRGVAECLEKHARRALPAAHFNLHLGFASEEMIGCYRFWYNFVRTYLVPGIVAVLYCSDWATKGKLGV